MSSGKIHRRWNNVVTIAATGGALVLGGWEPALPVFLGCVAGTAISPDYDLNAALPASFLKNIPGWKALWRPYQLLVKHRSFWSHFPFVGTTGRIAYLLAWLFGLLWVLNSFGFAPTPEDVVHFISSNGAVFTITYLFWCAQDIVHFLLDL